MKSIKTRIVLFSTVLFSITLGTGLFLALIFLKSAHDRNIAHTFEQSDLAVQSLLEALHKRMKDEASLLVEIPILHSVLQQKNAKTLGHSLEKYRDQLRLDFIHVFDAHGTVLSSLSKDPQYKPMAVNARYEELVRRAQRGEIFSSIISLDNRIAIVGLAPFGSSSQYQGVLVLGTEVGSEYAKLLKGFSGADISIRLPDSGAMASSLSSAQRETLQAILSKLSQPPERAQWIDGHALRMVPLQDSQGKVIAELLSDLSLAEMIRIRDQMLRAVVIVGLLIFLFSLVFSNWMGQALTRRLVDVINATKRIASGDFSFKIAENSQDEVGELAKAVNQMGDRIVGLLVEEKKKASYEKELETANTVQSTFFSPHRSLSAPFAIASFYQPTHLLGGDWWGHYTLAEGVELILIGDATGHGLPAALVTAMAYATSDMYAQIFARETQAAHPSKVLDELNRMLHNCLEAKLGMSFFAAIFDAHQQKITYSNAGHCFPYLIPKDPNDERINKNHSHPLPCVALNYKERSAVSILGMDAQTEFADVSMPLKKGDRVIFYTDGVTEARSPEGKMWGTRHLLKSMAHHQDKGLQDLCDHVIQDLRNFDQKISFADDVTLVAVEYFSDSL